MKSSTNHYYLLKIHWLKPAVSFAQRFSNSSNTLHNSQAFRHNLNYDVTSHGTWLTEPQVKQDCYKCGKNHVNATGLS
jgi:hypothetical protein